jgi:hypothetical protein
MAVEYSKYYGFAAATDSDSGSGAGTSTSTVTASYVFPEPITVTKIIWNGSATASVDGYSSYTSQSSSVLFELEVGGAWITIATNSGGASASSSGTDLTAYSVVTGARYTCTASAYADHDHATTATMTTFEIYRTPNRKHFSGVI